MNIKKELKDGKTEKLRKRIIRLETQVRELTKENNKLKNDKISTKKKKINTKQGICDKIVKDPCRKCFKPMDRLPFKDKIIFLCSCGERRVETKGE